MGESVGEGTIVEVLVGMGRSVRVLVGVAVGVFVGVGVEVGFGVGVGMLRVRCMRLSACPPFVLRMNRRSVIVPFILSVMFQVKSFSGVPTADLFSSTSTFHWIGSEPTPNSSRQSLKSWLASATP